MATSCALEHHIVVQLFSACAPVGPQKGRAIVTPLKSGGTLISGM